MSFNSANAGKFFSELNSKGLYQSSGKEKESCCLVFPSSTKHEIRHFHVVVVQRRLRNVQKSVMHVQICCFVNLNLLAFLPFSLPSPSSLLKLPNSLVRRRLGIFFLPKNHYLGNLMICKCQSKRSTFPTVLPVLKQRYLKAFVEPSILVGIRPTINCKIRKHITFKSIVMFNSPVGRTDDYSFWRINLSFNNCHFSAVAQIP